MKFFTYNSFFICFTILVVLYIYFNTLHNVEEFTPTIRTIYRPYIRNARIIGEGFFVKQKITIANFLRKFGII